jgi:DNA-binding transcriptional LysR family regulator
MGPLHLDGIPEFILAVQLESFTAAALQLGVTSSAVGKSVSRLEKRLGVKLLHRTTRKLSLTSEGDAYLATCLRVMEDLQETEGFLATGLVEPRGRVRIDLPAAFGRRYIAPMLIELSRRYPQLDLAITFAERTVDMIAEGIDLVVRIGDLKDDPDLIARRLGEQHLVICASPDYLTGRPPINDRTDLLGHDCIVGWRKGRRATWLLKGGSGLQNQEIRVRHELGDGDLLLRAVLDGCGLCQVPTWLVDEQLRSGELVTVLDQYAGVRMPINVIWPRTSYIQRKVRVVIDALVMMTRSNPDLFLTGQSGE